MDFTPHTERDIREMLDCIGVSSIEDLFANIPASERLPRPLDLPAPLSEQELSAHFQKLAGMNATLNDHRSGSYTSFLGAGAYQHFIPSVINTLSGRGEFLTAYTPYQPEVSQGTLQAIFEFQTMICQLTKMEVANASMYDGASATAEAVLMAQRVQKQRGGVVIAKTVHPEYQGVTSTYISQLGSNVISNVSWNSHGEIDLGALKAALAKKPASVVIQSPNFLGIIEPLDEIIDMVHENGALAIVVVNNPTSLGMFEAPGAFGADIVVGEAQAFGNPIGFGGPHIGFFASREALVRNLPGKIAGETTDSRGQRAFALTLSTREQHIRREKATSNICTNQGVCALRATIYLSLLGEDGVKDLAKINFSQGEYLKKRLTGISSVELPFDGTTYNEFVIKVGGDKQNLTSSLMNEGIIPGLWLNRFYPELSDHLLINVTELHSKNDLDKLVDGIEKGLKA